MNEWMCISWNSSFERAFIKKLNFIHKHYDARHRLMLLKKSIMTYTISGGCREYEFHSIKHHFISGKINYFIEILNQKEY